LASIHKPGPAKTLYGSLAKANLVLESEDEPPISMKTGYGKTVKKKIFTEKIFKKDRLSKRLGTF